MLSELHPGCSACRNCRRDCIRNYLIVDTVQPTNINASIVLPGVGDLSPLEAAREPRCRTMFWHLCRTVRTEAATDDSISANDEADMTPHAARPQRRQARRRQPPPVLNFGRALISN
jgi:hypothetical protein